MTLLDKIQTLTNNVVKAQGGDPNTLEGIMLAVNNMYPENTSLPNTQSIDKEEEFTGKDLEETVGKLRRYRDPNGKEYFKIKKPGSSEYVRATKEDLQKWTEASAQTKEMKEFDKRMLEEFKARKKMEEAGFGFPA